MGWIGRSLATDWMRAFHVPVAVVGLAILEMAVTSLAVAAQDLDEREPQISRYLDYLDTPYPKFRLSLDSLEQFTLNRMTGNRAGRLAFLDYMDEQVVTVDAGSREDATRSFVKFGGGLGEGPREFGNTFDVKFLNRDHLLVADLSNSRITQWDTQGTFVKGVPMEELIPSRLAVCGDGSLYVILQNYTRNGMFALVDPEGEVRNVFQRISRFSRQSVFHRDGSIVCDGGDLIYAAYYFDFIRRYRPDGSLVYSRSIMGFEPNKTLVTTGSNEMGSYITRSPDARRSVGEMDVMGGRLFMGYSDHVDGLMRQIDLYDPETGEYEATIPFPELFEEFALDANGIYVVTPAFEDEPAELVLYAWPERLAHWAADLLEKSVAAEGVRRGGTHITDSANTSSKP